MQKILFVRLRPALLLLLLLACAGLHAESAKRGLLWQVETPQGAVSYLFGTIHSEDPRVLALPEPVKQAFGASHTLVLEMDLGTVDKAEMGKAMMLPPDQDLQRLIGAKLYHQSVSAMAGRGYPEEAVRRLQPWAIILTLSMPQPKTGLYLDNALYLRAAEQGMTVLGLEQMDEQLGVFTSLSLAEQISLLRDTLGEHEMLPQLFEQVLEAYLQRDLGRLAELGKSSASNASGTQKRFMGTLVDKRNTRMAQRLLPLLEKGGVFAAVGALHLPGETGLLAQLRQQGMRLRAVY